MKINYIFQGGVCVQYENGDYGCACKNDFGNFPDCDSLELECDPSCEPKGECVLAGVKLKLLLNRSILTVNIYIYKVLISVCKGIHMYVSASQ